ncbi:MAG: diacylglycerol kinase [Candidatus Eremiobacteraeota bacterium]|nr:diacylglycerol kinase [Candidatus Eremiobacteraeota bacterium]
MLQQHPPSEHHPHVHEAHGPGYKRITESKFWSSFHHAFSGIIYAAKTQPNMRVHLIIAAAVLIATLALRLERSYVIGIVILIALVLALELVNTAVEAIVDLLTVAHHPLAKTAKDAAAGAVLLATMAAVVVGYLAFYEGIFRSGARVYAALAQVPSNTVLVIVAVVVIGTIIAKALVGRGSALQGGAVSGHSALAFCAATILSLYYQRPLVALLAFGLAALVAQSRVEAQIHNVAEVTWGAILGTAVTLAIYVAIRPHVL